MELIDKMKKIMAEDFGIETDEQLKEALNAMKQLDIGIFAAPIQEEKTA